MTDLHGRFVIGDGGKEYRWKQALCRERYGLKYKSYMKLHRLVNVDDQALQIAIQWEDGETPSWVEGYK